MICTKGHKLEVLKSAAGYYIGTMDGYEPYCRISKKYWETKDGAQAALDNLDFHFRYADEILFCSMGECILVGKANYGVN